MPAVRTSAAALPAAWLDCARATLAIGSSTESRCLTPHALPLACRPPAIQACEEWCELMMACDELEHDHMVALAMVRSAGFVSPKPYCLFCSQAPATHVPR